MGWNPSFPMIDFALNYTNQILFFAFRCTFLTLATHSCIAYGVGISFLSGLTLNFGDTSVKFVYIQSLLHSSWHVHDRYCDIRWHSSRIERRLCFHNPNGLNGPARGDRDRCALSRVR